jgi:ABC-2 type transport system ATP-binding protein
VLAFLGPNGAGKTTTMRILTCFMPATEGTARVAGFDCFEQPQEVKRRIGYLPETPPVYQELTVSEYLTFVGRIKGMDATSLRAGLARVVERLSLGDVQHRLIGNLSRGYRQRVGLAQALLHDPDVLVLDEPTDGLDPNQKHEVRKLITELSPGKAIIISTHILEEVDAVCTRAIIIARGRIVADDSPARLAVKSRYYNAVSVQLDQPDKLVALRTALAALPSVAEVEMSERDGRVTALPRSGATILPAVAELAAAQGFKLKELHLESGRLDEVFRSITN